MPGRPDIAPAPFFSFYYLFFMSSGRIHERNNMVMLPFFMLMAVFLTSNPWLIVCFVAGYVLSTYYLPPDLDTVSNAYHRYGRFRFIWKPYQKLFSHRGLSHFVLIGTLTRVIYLMILTFGTYLMFAWLLAAQPWADVQLNTAGITSLLFEPARFMELPFRNHIIWLFGGLFTGDLMHIFFDHLSSFVKRRLL